jgi:hypothetical protein
MHRGLRRLEAGVWGSHVKDAARVVAAMQERRRLEVVAVKYQRIDTLYNYHQISEVWGP